MNKIILDLCGGTEAWSRPYKEAGYEVINVTLPEYDVRRCWFNKLWLILPKKNDDNRIVNISSIYGILAAPPCTMFSFARTRAKVPRNLREGMETVIACLNIIWGCQYQIKSDQQRLSPLKFWALENPYFSSLSWFLGKPAFTFDPYEFGDGYKKRTALWGNFKIPIKNPKQMTTKMLELCKRNSKPLVKFDGLKTKDISPENYGKYNCQARRSITPPGFARAFFEANR